MDRVLELSARRTAVANAFDALKAKRPAGHDPEEIEAMLDAVPGLRPAIEAATGEELAANFRALDVTITYDKAAQTLDLSATIGSELLGTSCLPS